MIKPKIVAVLIVKNEEKYLARCLNSIKGVDDIYIVDTGSTDRTIEIARIYTQNVFTDYKWEAHFAKARNNALSRVPDDGNTWILSIDADEYLHDFNKVKEAVDLAISKRGKCIDIYLISDDAKPNIHRFPRIFKKDPEVFWLGAAHNHLNISSCGMSEVKITYGCSPTHYTNPNRTLDILEEDVRKNKGPREMFYLAREYWYRGEYKKCLELLKEYCEKSDFKMEKADAYLTMARCCWMMAMGDEAREYCVRAIILNAHFKEAILFMATLAGRGSTVPEFEKNADQWERMAETADNSNLLFIR